MPSDTLPRTRPPQAGPARSTRAAADVPLLKPALLVVFAVALITAVTLWGPAKVMTVTAVTALAVMLLAVPFTVRGGRG